MTRKQRPSALLSKRQCWILLSLCFLYIPTTVQSFVIPPAPITSRHAAERYNTDPKFLFEEAPPSDDVPIMQETQVVEGSIQTAAMVIGQQSLLIPLSLLLSFAFSIHFPLRFDGTSLLYGLGGVLPLAGLAVALDVVEDRYPQLRDVTIATQRAVLLFMGGTFRPVITSVAAMGIGLSAGFGEELLFRGVIQTQLVEVLTAFGEPTAVVGAILLSGGIFGLLHAVTPLYAFLATLASFYFGYLLVAFDGNLAVPIIAHTVYDFGALVYAHWEIGDMSPQEKMDLLRGPGEKE